jgi:hypothetical protein
MEACAARAEGQTKGYTARAISGVGAAKSDVGAYAAGAFGRKKTLNTPISVCFVFTLWSYFLSKKCLKSWI